MSDLRDSLRMLRSNPGVSILAATALALGIGSTTTMYSITRGILRDLPVDRPERLMHVAMTDRNEGDEYLRIPAADIVALREQQHSFEAMAAYEDESVHLGDADHRADRPGSARGRSEDEQHRRTEDLVETPHDRHHDDDEH